MPFDLSTFIDVGLYDPEALAPFTAAVNTALGATPQNIAQASGEALQGSILCGINENASEMTNAAMLKTTFLHTRQCTANCSLSTSPVTLFRAMFHVHLQLQCQRLQLQLRCQKSVCWLCNSHDHSGHTCAAATSSSLHVNHTRYLIYIMRAWQHNIVACHKLLSVKCHKLLPSIPTVPTT